MADPVTPVLTSGVGLLLAAQTLNAYSVAVARPVITFDVDVAVVVVPVSQSAGAVPPVV